MFTWSYSQWQANQARENEDRLQARRLHLEVVTRVRSVFNLLDNAQNAEHFFAAISILDNPKLGNFSSSVFPEFRNRPVRSLLWELSLIGEKRRRYVLPHAITAAEEISDEYQKAVLKLNSEPGFRDKPVPKEEDKKLRGLLLKIMKSLGFVREIHLED